MHGLRAGRVRRCMAALGACVGMRRLGSSVAAYLDGCRRKGSGVDWSNAAHRQRLQGCPHRTGRAESEIIGSKRVDLRRPAACTDRSLASAKINLREEKGKCSRTRIFPPQPLHMVTGGMVWSRPVQVANPWKFEAACSVPGKLTHKGFAPRTRAGQQWGAQVQGGEQCGHGLSSHP